MSGLTMGCAMLSILACGRVDDGPDRPLARAYDQVLTWADLREVIPAEATGADSAAMADQFIEAWMRQEAILHMAEQNQVANGMDLDAQLEDYRRSLVIFGYEQALVDQKLDTNVTAEQMEAYYTEHKANFELKEAVLRMRWFKVNEPDKRTLRKMTERFRKGEAEDLHHLEIWLAHSGVAIVDHSAGWVPVSIIRSEMGLPPGEEGTALEQVGRQVITSTNGAWFVEVLELRAQNSLSPIDMVRARILAKKWASEEDLKKIDAEVRQIVAEAAEFASQDPEPDPSELWTDVLV